MLTKAEIQRLRSLREKKHREELGLFVVEGEKVVAELLDARFPLLELYVTPEWTGSRNATAAAGGARVIALSPADMARVSHFPTPSSVLAIGRISQPALSPATLDHGLTLALDGVQDPGNVGTLLRIADWFGFDRVVLSSDCADLFSQKVVNASMGSFARMTAIRTDLARALETVAAGVPILGCDLEGTSVYALGPATDAVVVIGSEGRGLSDAVSARLRQRVTIPRHGGAESLNAAVAAGIVCACLRRPAGK